MEINLKSGGNWRPLEWCGRLLIIAAWLAHTVAGNASPSVTLAWDAAVELDVAGYRLYQGTASGTYDQSIDVQNTTTNTVEHLESGTTYFFAVVAYNTVGLESDFSNEISFTPSAPAAPIIVDVGHRDSSLVLTWISAAGQSYRVLSKNRLEDPQWVQASDVLSAIGPRTSWKEPQSTDAGQRFYAIVLVNP